MKRVTIEYPLDSDAPKFLESVFIQLEPNGQITIGLIKKDGVIYHNATVPAADFKADVAFLMERDDG